MRRIHVAVIAGDGVGGEVVPEAKRAVEAAGVPVEWADLPWGSRWWHETGQMMPADALETIASHDAVLLGAVGDPIVPDHVSLWGLVLAIRQGLDLWANVRPVRLFDGIVGPLANRGPADIDMLFVRENSEGEYSGVGGRTHRGTSDEVAVESAIFTRHAIERVIRYAFEQARSRRGRLVSATKSNAARYGYVLWDEIAEQVRGEYPDVGFERVLVDALAARMVLDPASLDVVVASNLFGDILTDLAAALQGGMGMAASGNIAPGTQTPGVFEPVHGSAPTIAGQGIANPLACIWSASLLLAHLGHQEAADRLVKAIEIVCAEGPKTGDIGGAASTSEVGDAVVALLQAGATAGIREEQR